MNAGSDAMSIMTGDPSESRWLMTMSMFRRILFLTPLAIAAMQSSFAASPSVTAVLNDSQPVIGQMVQLEIKVNGTHSAAVPKEISVDGLEIHQTSQQYESSLSFGFGSDQNASSVTYGYTVLPLKAGHFKIPPQTVRVGSSSLQTPELRLDVIASTDSGDLRNVARVELVLPKQTAYVGEAIPAEIRISILR